MSRFSSRIKPFRFPIIVVLIIALFIIIAAAISDPFFANWAIYPVIVYSIYPPLLNISRLIHRKEYASLIIEFQWLKIFVLVLLPPYVIIKSIFEVGRQLGDPCGLLPCGDSTIYFGALLSAFTIGVCIRTLTFMARKEIRNDFTKWCCRIISEKEDDFEKMKFLRLLLESYDRYLRTRLKVGINENKIYSIILSKSAEERSQVINQICKSLEGHKLDLAKYLSSIHKIPDSEFYIRETFLQQLKPIGVILAAAIPIIISIISILK